MPAPEYKDNAVISLIISLLEAFQQLYVMNKMKHFSYKSGCGICITKRLRAFKRRLGYSCRESILSLIQQYKYYFWKVLFLLLASYMLYTRIELNYKDYNS